ncbi:MAG: AAA family ATPase [Deltaproteobacteria bacterium]|nr:AAA family ATPase [Deltaproteobacteria bacterium]
MIRSLTVDGYKGLVGTSIGFNLEGPTVLLGPNGSGKTTIIEAIDGLWSVASRQLKKTRFASSRTGEVTYRGEDRHVSFSAELSSDGKASGAAIRLTWGIELHLGDVHAESIRGKGGLFDGEILRPRGGQAGESAPFGAAEWRSPAQRPAWLDDALAVHQAIGPVRIARFLPRRIAESCSPTATVDPDGFGLPSALLLLLTSDRRQFVAVEQRFRKLFPWVDEILPEPGVDAQGHTVVNLTFRERGSRHPFAAEHVSSGMLLALALLWVTMRSEPDRILCFEEPENSLHPYLLGEAYELLGQAARGELAAEAGPATTRAGVQVVVATHSVDFVNLCKPEEVRVCERDAEGVVKVSAVVDQAGLADALKNYQGALGELWYSGALGGIPKNRPAAGSR